jgi:NhaA family Na+:H+ antiporter
VRPLREFLQAEASGGVVLVAAALVAVVWANSPLSETYSTVWNAHLRIGFGTLSLDETLRHWVNDALMAIFFFVVGLEIKRELVVGELRDPRAAALPVMAAFGGVALPAVLFLALVGGGEAARGWGIPMATDIAFAVGVLALLGDRVPAGAKLMLLSIAIVDDIIAIAVIALFYSDSLDATWLLGAGVGLAVVVVLRRLGVTAIWPYALVGVLTWLATFESGVHATIAGVALGLLTPTGEVGGRRVLEQLEHRLHPVSAFVIVPLFALANAGVDLRGGVLVDAATSRLTIAVVVGLVVGKILGITVATLAAQSAGIGVLPHGVTTRHVCGLAALGGIGFTVSLFITDLAYDDTALIDQAKVGIFAASLLAALLGTAILRSGRRLSRAECDVEQLAASGERPG